MTQPRPSGAPRSYARPRPPSSERERVLARRRMALIVLGAAVPVTLLAAILTGSWALLVLNLLVNVALAAYIALLLQIKQTRASMAGLQEAMGEGASEVYR